MNEYYTLAQNNSAVYKDFLRGVGQIDWDKVVKPAVQNPRKESPIDDSKVKLDFSKLLGETKFTLNQNN